MEIEYYEKMMKKISEAKLVNEGLADLENGNTIDGDIVRAKMEKLFNL